MSESTESTTRLRDLLSGCLNYSLGQKNLIRNMRDQYSGVIYDLCLLVGALSLINIAIAIQILRSGNAT